MLSTFLSLSSLLLLSFFDRAIRPFNLQDFLRLFCMAICFSELSVSAPHAALEQAASGPQEIQEELRRMHAYADRQVWEAHVALQGAHLARIRLHNHCTTPVKLPVRRRPGCDDAQTPPPPLVEDGRAWRTRTYQEQPTLSTPLSRRLRASRMSRSQRLARERNMDNVEEDMLHSFQLRCQACTCIGVCTVTQEEVLCGSSS